MFLFFSLDFLNDSKVTILHILFCRKKSAFVVQIRANMEPVSTNKLGMCVNARTAMKENNVINLSICVNIRNVIMAVNVRI